MIPTNVISKLWIIFSHCFYSSEAKQSCDSCIEHFSNETKLWFNLCFLPTETFARTWEMLLVKAQCLKQLQCLVRWRMCLWWNWARLKLQICRSGSRHSGPQNLTRWIVACRVSAIHATFFAEAAVEAIKDIIVDPDVRCAEQYFGWNQKIQAAHVEDDLASLGRPQIARFANTFVAGKEEQQIGLSRHIWRGLSGAWPPRAEQIACDWVDKEKGPRGYWGAFEEKTFWLVTIVDIAKQRTLILWTILYFDTRQFSTPTITFYPNAMGSDELERRLSKGLALTHSCRNQPLYIKYKAEKSPNQPDACCIWLSVQERLGALYFNRRAQWRPFSWQWQSRCFFFNTFWYLFRSCCWLWHLP